jgi:Flp pilus assembly protein TadD
MEARQKLADIAKQQGAGAARVSWLEEIIKSDKAAGSSRTDRTKYLAAKASLELALPARDAFNAVRLTLPLKKSIEAKKASMQRAIGALQAADSYAIAEVSTSATFEMAELYRHLASDLMKSERPKTLAGEELEQYDLLLEEQAFPFEEKAIDIHLVNAARAAEGLYDESVRASFTALAGLKPARFGKTEEGEDLAIDVTAGAVASEAPREPVAATKGPAAASPSVPVVPLAVSVRFQEAVAAAEHGQADVALHDFEALESAAPAVAGPSLNKGILLARAGRWKDAASALEEAVKRNPASAAAYDELAIAYRQLGEFPRAHEAYGHAVELDAGAPRVHRNLGVFLDLYAQKPTDALGHYEKAQSLGSADDKQLAGWIAEVRQRLNLPRAPAPAAVPAQAPDSAQAPAADAAPATEKPS